MTFFPPFWSNNFLRQTVTTYSQEEYISIQNGGSLLISMLKIVLWSSLAICTNVLKVYINIHSNDPREILGFQEMVAFGNLSLACQVLPDIFRFAWWGGGFLFVVH